MKAADDRNSREQALRFGADRICLWLLCGKAECLRARACRGDARVCAGLACDWLEALDAEKRTMRSFAAIERQLATPEQLRAYRAWRKALEALR
jgi:hypothetical protein